MNERIKNMWGWIKEHKKEIAIAGLISIGSAAGGVFLYEKIKSINVANDWVPTKFNVSDVDFDGNLVRHHDGATEIFVYDCVPLAVMGKFGENIIENIPDLPDNPTTMYVELVIPK